MEKAALNHPDFTFIVYHSAIQHGPTEPDWKASNNYDPTTGDFAWHNVLMGIKQRNPQTAVEVLVMKLVSPEYCAVIEWSPALRTDVA